MSIAEIKARLAAATPGPWEHNPSNGISAPYANSDEPEVLVQQLCEFSLGPQGYADCDLCVHAPTDIARLIRALELCMEQRDRHIGNRGMLTVVGDVIKRQENAAIDKILEE